MENTVIVAEGEMLSEGIFQVGVIFYSLYSCYIHTLLYDTSWEKFFLLKLVCVLCILSFTKVSVCRVIYFWQACCAPCNDIHLDYFYKAVKGNYQS